MRARLAKDRPEPKIPIVGMVPRAIIEAIDRIAEREDRSRSAVINQALRAWIEREDAV